MPREGASVEVGAGELTIYDNVDRDGETVWKDLCRGPHVPSTAHDRQRLGSSPASPAPTGAAARRTRSCSASTAPRGPRRTSCAPTRQRLEEAAKRDHRKLGKELDLFSFPDEIGSGLSVWHPRGGIIRGEMEQHARRRHVEGGYTYVYTPHISKEDLFLQSNHLVTYKEGMFPPIRMDEERGCRAATSPSTAPTTTSSR